MHKKLMAAAVAGALAVPALAVAQSTVQIYGQAEWEHAYLDQGDGRPNTHYHEINGSYLGFKGTENLGGGLSAWFQCETTMDTRAIDQVGLCSRNSGLGLRGGFGNVWAGRWHTPMSRAIGMAEVGGEATGNFGVSYLPAGGSGSTSIMAYTDNNGGSQTRRRFRRRETCLTTYETPKMGGFMVGGAISCGNYAAEKSMTDSNENKTPYIWSLAGTYSNGPLNVGLAYEKHLDVGDHAAGSKTLDDDGWGLSATYRFGAVLVGGYYMDRKWEMNDGDIKKKSATFGVEWKIAGPHNLLFNYGWLDDSKGSSKQSLEETSAGGIAAPGSNTGAQSYSVSYRYDLSKRTGLTLAWTRMDNDSNSVSARLGTAASVLKRGDTQDAYGLIMKHKF